MHVIDTMKFQDISTNPFEHGRKPKAREQMDWSFVGLPTMTNATTPGRYSGVSRLCGGTDVGVGPRLTVGCLDDSSFMHPYASTHFYRKSV